jgi:S-phase kinase-associated protein 1
MTNDIPIKLICSDGELTIPHKYAELSDTIRVSLEETGTNVIMLNGITMDTMVWVIRYMELAHGQLRDPIPETDKYRVDNLHHDDKDFMDKVVAAGLTRLFDITNAANYLDYKHLLDLCVKTIASMIKGKTRDEVVEIFKLEDSTTSTVVMSAATAV